MQRFFSRWHTLLSAALAAALLHALLFLLFVWLVQAGVFQTARAATEQEITLSFIEPLPGPSSEAPEPPAEIEEPALLEEEPQQVPQRFIDTPVEPEEVEREEQVPFFSDRDTRAASTQPATGGAPVPSQQGRDLPGIDLVEQDFADGSGQQPAPNVSPQPRSASAQRALAQATPEQESLEPREEQEPNPAQEPTPESADRPVTDPRETPLEQVEDLPEPDQPLEETPDQPEPSPEPEPEPETDAPREVVEEPRENRDEEYEPENYEPDPELLALLEARSPEQPQAPEPLPAPEPAEDAEPRPEDPVTPREPQEERPNVRELLEAQRRRANPGSVSGFQEERTVTTLRGNISNRGDQNSVAAEKTPLGVYHKAISSAVSKVWQRYTRQSSHLFRIGTVKIRMKIYPSGRVSDIEVIDNTANESFATNTIRAINDAEIPPMPPEVRELMLDDPVKVEYTFSIY